MKIAALILLFFTLETAYAQDGYNYEVSNEFPYGKLNPNAPKQLLDFGQLIGEYDCTSETRKADQSWNEPEKIIWRWKYIMNGNGIQDETLKPDGSHSGSIRQYDSDSLTWRVHYYTNKSTPSTLSAWTGGMTDAKEIVLYNEQKAPNGMDGYYKITFFDMTDKGFNWLGEWVDKQQTFSYPTWKITCKSN